MHIIYRNRRRICNLKISKALLKSQAHQGTSLFTSAATNQRGLPKGGQVKLRSDFQNIKVYVYIYSCKKLAALASYMNICIIGWFTIQFFQNNPGWSFPILMLGYNIRFWNSGPQLRQKLYKRALSGFFVLGLLKIGEGPRCVTYFREGGPGMCDEVWQREGSKNDQKQRDVLYGRPLKVASRTLTVWREIHLRLRPQFGLKFKAMPHVDISLVM